MLDAYQTEWIEHPAAIDRLCDDAVKPTVYIGGRFLFASEEEEDRLASALAAAGFILCDVSQLELVAGRMAPRQPEAVQQAIAQMRDTAAELGVRLQSVEAGDPEGGDATVLAGEAGYQPWWNVR